MSAQRPLYRAYQQNPEAVEEFESRTYPALRQQAEAQGATIYFADEAGIRTTTAARPGHRSGEPRW